jgi:citrate lyase subunit beta / citryl-CoA lyase
MTAEPRSWLFIPGDSEKKLAKIADSGADAVIIDLEDSVAPANKAVARTMTAEWLSTHVGKVSSQLWVRINALDCADSAEDVAVMARIGVNGLVQPKAEGPADVEKLSAMLDACGDIGQGIRIHAIATETARAIFKLGDFADHQPARLTALSWGAEDLATAISATGNRDAHGAFYPAFGHARTLALFAAHAAGVQAVDTLDANFRDLEGLRSSSQRARAEGFSGRLAIHPAQVAVINAAFLPTPQEVEFAQKIVEAFAGAGAVGTIGLDGKMIDRPHLLQSEKLLARHKAYST